MANDRNLVPSIAARRDGILPLKSIDVSLSPKKKRFSVDILITGHLPHICIFFSQNLLGR